MPVKVIGTDEGMKALGLLQGIALVKLNWAKLSIWLTLFGLRGS